MKTAIIGGGAAGFFCAIWLGKLVDDMEITIFEQQKKVLAKVEISGGGRCNCTNTFEGISDLVQVYPRGANLMKRLFKQFSPADTFKWFEKHGVELTIQDDHCVFPKAQDSHVIIDCLMKEAKKVGVNIQLSTKIIEPTKLLAEYNYVVVTVGGLTNNAKSHMQIPAKLTPSVPSLFTFNIKDKELRNRMGIVAKHVIASLPSTRLKAQGPLLITHWGMSGPAILKLSSYAATYLAERQYQSSLSINWTGEKNTEIVKSHLINCIEANHSKLVDNIHPYEIQASLWDYLISKAGVKGKRCTEIGKRNINQLTEILTNDIYYIDGRCHYKDEYVTCGGVSLTDVRSDTLESKQVPNLFFAGEVLDIDGITGGFNFQAAWSTAYAVANGIAQKVKE